MSRTSARFVALSAGNELIDEVRRLKTEALNQGFLVLAEALNNAENAGGDELLDKVVPPAAENRRTN